MKKKYKITLTIIFILIILAIGAGCYFYFFHEKTEEPPTIKEVKITNTIDSYGYTLEDRDTILFKTKFEELKQLLNEENYDQKEYIKLVSELFIIDLYTIKNKISRYDIGGLEYIYKDAVPSFKSVVESTIYKTVENNIDELRSQKLPIVADIEVGEITQTTYKMPDETEVSGYRVPLSWTYEEDLGYDTSGVLILIPDEKKMSIVFYKPKN